MDIIVQKFGGTSVATHENRERVVTRILNEYKKGNKVVVIVSAIGRKGDPYATDSFLNLVNRKKLSTREIDLLVSCGEIISAVVLANHISDKGYRTIVYTGFQAGIETDDKYGNADIISVNPQNILNSLKEDKIVIVAGFQGITKDGNITTLGRGGSDTTAVALGEALKCKYVEIYTDVDGIMTADPRVVPDARLIEKICYQEVYQLAEDGAKVIHPKAVEIAERGNIEIKIKNTLKECDGTIITTKEATNFYSKDSKWNDRIISALTYKKNRAQVIIEINGNKYNTNLLLKEITERNISIDLINFFVDKKIFTIDEEDVNLLEDILKNSNCNFKIIRNCCKISAIGHRMRGIPGVMSRIVAALAESNIEILQTADSHTTIWCLIREKDMEKALRALHREFCLDDK